MAVGRYVHVYEPTDPRLGRHVVHDPRSRNFALPSKARPTSVIAWPRVGPILDQGQLGSCTGNAAVGLLMTQPFSNGTVYSEADAVSVYSAATILDDSEIPGHYPPSDTGSAGVYVMQVLQQRGLITGYQHAFSLDAALAALVNGPIAVGSVWLQSMFNPDSSGTLKVKQRSGVAGGHEYVVDGYDPTKDAVRMTNSWGTSWGVQGQAWIRTDDFGWLLSQSGDVVQPTVPVGPSPTPDPTPTPEDADAVLAAALKTWLAAKNLG